MRSISLAVAMCLLVGSQMTGARGNAFEEDVRVIWALPGSEPVGFQETRQAIVNMLEKMNEHKVAVAQDEILGPYHKSLERFNKACELDKAKCLSVFSEIEELKKENSDNINIIPYLNGCEKRQSDFCRGGDKPNPLASFFGKIATLCSPGDRECE